MACSLVVKDALLLLLLAMIVFLWVIVSQSGLLEGCMFALCFSQLSRAGEARGCLGVSFEHTATKGDVQYPWSISSGLPTVHRQDCRTGRSDRVGASERRRRRDTSDLDDGVASDRARWSGARLDLGAGTGLLAALACQAERGGPVSANAARPGRMNMR